MSTNIHVRPISHAVSNAPLPDHVYVLPQHLQAQPALVRPACQACLVSLVTTSKGPISNGTAAGLARSFMGAHFCARNDTYGVCDPCKAAHKGSCLAVSVVSKCRRHC